MFSPKTIEAVLLRLNNKTKKTKYKSTESNCSPKIGGINEVKKTPKKTKKRFNELKKFNKNKSIFDFNFKIIKHLF